MLNIEEKRSTVLLNPIIAVYKVTNEGKLHEGVGTRDGVCCHDCKIENIINDIFRGE